MDNNLIDAWKTLNPVLQQRHRDHTQHMEWYNTTKDKGKHGLNTQGSDEGMENRRETQLGLIRHDQT